MTSLIQSKVDRTVRLFNGAIDNEKNLNNIIRIITEQITNIPSARKRTYDDDIINAYKDVSNIYDNITTSSATPSIAAASAVLAAANTAIHNISNVAAVSAVSAAVSAAVSSGSAPPPAISSASDNYCKIAICNIYIKYFNDEYINPSSAVSLNRRILNNTIKKIINSTLTKNEKKQELDKIVSAYNSNYIKYPQGNKNSFNNAIGKAYNNTNINTKKLSVSSLETYIYNKTNTDPLSNKLKMFKTYTAEQDDSVNEMIKKIAYHPPTNPVVIAINTVINAAQDKARTFTSSYSDDMQAAKDASSVCKAAEDARDTLSRDVIDVVNKVIKAGSNLSSFSTNTNTPKAVCNAMNKAALTYLVKPLNDEDMNKLKKLMKLLSDLKQKTNRVKLIISTIYRNKIFNDSINENKIKIITLERKNDSLGPLYICGNLGPGVHVKRDKGTIDHFNEIKTTQIIDSMGPLYRKINDTNTFVNCNENILKDDYITSYDEKNKENLFNTINIKSKIFYDNAYKSIIELKFNIEDIVAEIVGRTIIINKDTKFYVKPEIKEGTYVTIRGATTKPMLVEHIYENRGTKTFKLEGNQEIRHEKDLKISEQSNTAKSNNVVTNTSRIMFGYNKRKFVQGDKVIFKNEPGKEYTVQSMNPFELVENKAIYTPDQFELAKNESLRVGTIVKLKNGTEYEIAAIPYISGGIYRLKEKGKDGKILHGRYPKTLLTKVRNNPKKNNPEKNSDKIENGNTVRVLSTGNEGIVKKIKDFTGLRERYKVGRLNELYKKNDLIKVSKNTTTFARRLVNNNNEFSL